MACHSSKRFINGPYKNFIKTVRAAIFGKIANNSVTEVGEP